MRLDLGLAGNRRWLCHWQRPSLKALLCCLHHLPCRELLQVVAFFGVHGVVALLQKKGDPLTAAVGDGAKWARLIGIIGAVLDLNSAPVGLLHQGGHVGVVPPPCLKALAA